MTPVERIIPRCRHLATLTEVEGETTRTFLCPQTREVHRLLTEWAVAAGARVHIDAIGNLHALYGPPHKPRLLLVSHIDTVPNAGAFDGLLGVLLALAVLESLPTPPEHLAIELIAFSEEEGIRFRRPFLGSLALTGQLHDLTLQDSAGVTIAEAVQTFGLDPSAIPAMRLPAQAIAALEVHIEQGPVLESLAQPLGIVTALVGQTRMELTFTGQANHAGTTPMSLRRDALAAAAAWIVAVEAHARATGGLVATVGRILALPGAGNVVPAQVTASLDLRHADDATRASALGAILTAANDTATTRGVSLTRRLLLDQPAVALSPRLTALLAQSALEAPRMTSGAGHDAMILAPHLPTAMLFLRSPGGLSHHPDESVHPEDVEAALAATIRFVQALAKETP